MLLEHNLRLVAEQDWRRSAIAFTAFMERPDGECDVALPLTLQRADPGQVTRPAFTLRKAQAQELMDELWKCGVRPAEGAGSAGQAAAMQKHLDDMRTVAWHALKIPR